MDPAADAPLPDAAMAALVRQKIKYVFVIFNENHSFDNEFGTFPGVDGIYSDGHETPQPPPLRAPPFAQTYTDLSGAVGDGDALPHRPAGERLSFTDSVDHSHKGLAKKLDVVDGRAPHGSASPPTNTSATPSRATTWRRPRARNSRVW